MDDLQLLEKAIREPPGHAIGMAAIQHPLGIAIACACGYEDTWLPHQTTKEVAKRWNNHTRRKIEHGKTPAQEPHR